MAGRCGSKEIIFLAFLLLYSFLSGCSKSEKEKKSQPNLAFENGDLIFRRGNGIFSPYFALLASKEKEYSHVGILCRTHDSVFVYHIEADELTGEGSVKKEPLTEFLQDVKKYEIRPLNLNQKSRSGVIHLADSLFKKQAAFDMDFDLNTHDRFYCTELVAYVLNAALNDSVVVPTLQMNHQKYYSLDDLYHCILVKNEKSKCRP